jgi:hypothetical protein
MAGQVDCELATKKIPPPKKTPKNKTAEVNEG